MTRPSPVSVEWFRKPPPRPDGGHGGTLLRIAIGAAAGAALHALGHPTVAIVAWTITAVTGALSLASPRARHALANALAALGRLAGSVVSGVLLTLMYLLVLTPARFVKRLSGVDELHLRDGRRASYYEPCDAPERKVRYAGAMFATELLAPRRRGGLVLVLTVLTLLALAEITLRTRGFGPGAVLYTPDARAGYYPTPNQKLDRYGGRVIVNNFGMRAPNFTRDKPEGTFRILMLGDSTLWGGSYIDQEQLYARILERELNRVAEGGKVEVLNMGTNGWGPYQKRGYVESFGTFGADLVLVCLPHDDADRDSYTLISQPYFAEGKPPRLALEEVMMHSMWRYRRSRISMTGTWREQQRALGVREYERLGVFLRQAGPEVFFELLPSESVGLGGEPGAVERDIVASLTSALRGHGIVAHYPAGLFAGKGKSVDLYHDEVHLHWQGHSVYAGFLLDQITRSSARFGKWIEDQRARRAR